MLERVFFLVLALALTGVAWSQDQASEQSTTGGTDQALEQVQDQVGEQAYAEPDADKVDDLASKLNDISPSDPGYEAYQKGVKAKEDGKVEEAEVYFQEAMDASGTDNDIYWAALEEVSFRLPLLRAKDMIAKEDWQDLEELLEALLEENRSDKEKTVYLLRLISQLRDIVPDGTAGQKSGTEDGRETMGQVERVLQRFHAENGRFPRGYDELNRVLPADEYPLENYDIVDYVSRNGFYGLTLRSKSDPDNLITVENTGLLK